MPVLNANVGGDQAQYRHGGLNFGIANPVRGSVIGSIFRRCERGLWLPGLLCFTDTEGRGLTHRNGLRQRADMGQITKNSGRAGPRGLSAAIPNPQGSIS